MEGGGAELRIEEEVPAADAPLLPHQEQVPEAGHSPRGGGEEEEEAGMSALGVPRSGARVEEEQFRPEQQVEEGEGEGEGEEGGSAGDEVAVDGAVSLGVEVEDGGVAVLDMDHARLPVLSPFPSVFDVAEGTEGAADVVNFPFVVDGLPEEVAEEQRRQDTHQEEEKEGGERGSEGAEAVVERAGLHAMEARDGVSADEMEHAQSPALPPLPFDLLAAEETEEATSLGPSPVLDDDVILDEDGAEEDDDEEGASAMAVEDKELTAALSNARGRGGGRRKRGRPPKAQVARLPAKKKEEEDLCFICFDGGNLVVCDRRGCPKVYHPACVNRDESFFRSRGRWNCGWHICSICEKAAHYMCFTCTYSLCKACIKESEFVCVRGNKGFCETCRSTVMLIETEEEGKKEKAGVDFDDRNSWMYLFKDYWLDLKRKLSITLEEISRAKNPWKGPLAVNEESSDELYDAKEDLDSSSDSSSVRREGNKPVRKKVRKRSKTTLGDEEPVKLHNNVGTPLPEDSEWASTELLEFVAHMRSGDKSVMCQFDVHTLLLEYIKRNNLRDPRRKSQIICDSRLERLFGKARVGHFEMLKLLESHFLVKEMSQAVTDDNQGGVVDPESSQMDTEGNSEVVPKTGSDKKRRSRKRIEEREPQNNLDDYAAINVHNISLIYMRRNLMEELLDDIENFNDKVVGSFVRIRISGAGQRQDMYRLVQVVGTGKAAEKYKTGKKTTDITLEILNLSKTEAIPIDSISNQEFTEEECERLRQSIKCGLINRLTVRDVLEKAMALQVVRVNESLENEKLRLSHLRDRASEKGRRKELRECVEKLQLLNSPEERSRRLNDIPEVHVDPNMDPNYESAEEELVDKKRDSFNRSTDSKFSKMGRDLNASRRGNLGSSDSWTGSRRGSTTRESSKNVPSRGAWDKIGTSGGSVDSVNGVTLNQDKDLYQANSWDMPKSMAAAAVTDAGAWSNGQAGIRPGQSSCLASETSTSQCAEATNMSNINENEKLWHYQDPSGKIQGPFSMTQLRKWNTTGYFPANLRIWRTLEKQEDSILLTDALIGKFQKENPPSEAQHNTSAQFPKFAPAMDARENNGEGNWRANNNSWAEKNKDEGNSSRNDTNFSGGNTNSGLAKADGWGGQSSAWSSPNMSPVVPRDGKVGGPSHVWEPSLHPNPWSGQSHIHGAPPPSAAPFSGNSYQLSAHQGRGRGGNPGRWKGGPSHGNNWGSNRPTAFHPSGHGHGHGHGRPHSANYVYPGHQSPGELWKAQGTSNSNNWGSDSLNLPTPTPRPGGGGWMGNPITGNQPSASPNVSVQPATSGWANTATQGGNSRQFPCVGGTDASRSFSAWVEQPPSTAHALTCWGQNPPLVKQTEMAASWDSSATATISVAKESTVAGGLSAPQTPTPYLQTATSVFDRQTSLANASASEVPPKDEMVKSSDGKMDGFVSNIIPRDFQKNRHMKDDCPSPTPKAEQAKFDALISESSHQNNVDVALIRKSSETHDAAAIGSPIRSVDGGQCDTTVASPATLETSKFSANNSPGSGRMEGKGEVLAENMIITEGISLTLPLESVEPEMQNKLVAIANQADPSLYLASGTKSGPSSNENSTSKPAGGADDLELPSSQKQLVEASDPKYCSKSQGKASNLSKSQETDTMVLNPAIKGDGLEQSRSLNPRQFYALDPEKSGNLGLPAETTEWSMPSPTPPIEPSGSPAGAQSAFGVSPSSYQWNSNVHLESVSLSNAGQGTGNNEITHMGVGICQENMNKGLEPAKESGHIDLGVVVQGTTSAGLGTAAVQGNTSGVWANPVQGNTNVNAGFVAPPQGNTNMNMLWVALTQANPGWGTPVQGNPNPNPGWVLTAPMNSPPVSNWGAVVPPGNPNANQNWVPVQVNTNPVSGWAASQNSANPNAGWFGHGNTNMGCNVPAGNPGSWGTQQKLNGDGYSGHSGRGIQSNDANHGAARHGWNRSQNSGGASRPPPGVQRVAICKYHESGHCKKGAHCNYLHT